MDFDEKPARSAYNCCIICLKNESLTHNETEISENVIRIYRKLVDDELLETTNFELCDDCIETLDNIGTFRKQCLNSIEILRRNIIGGSTHFVYVDHLQSDETQIKVENTFDEEDENDQNDAPLKTELFEEGESNTLKTESDPPPPKKQKKPKKSKKTHEETKCEAAFCSICGEFFTRYLVKHILSAHVMQIEDQKYKCNVCQEILRDSGHIMEHFNKHRDYEHPKVCKICDASFKNRQEYRVHLAVHKERKKRSYVCDCCDASYSSNTNLKYHIMSKHQGAMQCSYCNKAFFDQNEYETHVRMEKDKINGRKFYCDHCGYECKWKSALWIHMKKFHAPNESPIICNECGKTYKTRSQFRMHQVSSHLEKTHQCSDCGKKFAFATTLRKHIQSYHSEEGMFADCKVCGKKLKSSSMRTHMSAVHQQLRKFKCDLCDMTFKTAGTLLKHKFSHTKTRPFNCNLCSTGYYQNEYLRKHFERVHGIVYSGADIRKICGKKSWDYLAEKEKSHLQLQQT